MPDMGIAASASYRNNDGSPGSLRSGFEWAASIYTNLRTAAWIFGGGYGNISNNSSSLPNVVRCVGR